MSGIYVSAREKFLRAEIAWHSANIRAVLLTSAYTPNYETDAFLADIPAAARVSVSELVTNKTTTAGWASTDKIEWLTVTGANRVGLTLFKDTGDVSTSPLIAHIDNGVTNFPLEPTGAKVTFIPDPATGLFRL